MEEWKTLFDGYTLSYPRLFDEIGKKFGPTPQKRRRKANTTKNKRTGTTKTRRKMAYASRCRNRK
ncbi:MAG: hypothetical protein H8E28_00430 [Anaerolineae bacterium]|nr:hypothetical protein [Anaerolineae bacterium]